jgi:hypothetical protein
VDSGLMSTIAEEMAIDVITPMAERPEPCRIGSASGMEAPSTAAVEAKAEIIAAHVGGRKRRDDRVSDASDQVLHVLYGSDLVEHAHIGKDATDQQYRRPRHSAQSRALFSRRDQYQHEAYDKRRETDVEPVAGSERKGRNRKDGYARERGTPVKRQASAIRLVGLGTGYGLFERDPPPQQPETAEGHEHQGRDHGVEDQAVGEEQPGVLRQVPRRKYAVSDDAEGADRRVGARRGTRYDHYAHEEGADPVLGGGPERDRRHDGHSGRAQRADAGNQGGKGEHDPGHEPDVAPDQPDPPVHQQIHGPVVLRDGEQEGDPGQQDEQVAGEDPEYFVDGHAAEQRAHDESRDEPHDAEVDRQHRGHHEHDEQYNQRKDLNGHEPPPSA